MEYVVVVHMVAINKVYLLYIDNMFIFTLDFPYIQQTFVWTMSQKCLDVKKRCSIKRFEYILILCVWKSCKELKPSARDLIMYGS
jgi:hypothetical protein